MYIQELLYENNIGDLSPIKNEGMQFFKESVGYPILKNLPITYSNIQKVKVRKRKPAGTFSNTFNMAFNDELNDLRERSIFVNGVTVFQESAPETEPFYVFPIDGYKFIYSKEVDNSTEKYRHVLESILDKMGENTGKDIFKDLLKFTYISENLSKGILSGAEIIIYGIPYYYVIRESIISNYEELLTDLIK